MYCIECGHALPDIRDNSTICAKCLTPLSTWWDENSQTYRTNRESIMPYPENPYAPMELSAQYASDGTMLSRRNRQTEEERNFNAALICLEHHFERPNSYLSKAMLEVKKMVAKTLDLSLNKAEVRYVYQQKGFWVLSRS